MKRTPHDRASIEELVSSFIVIALAQHEAIELFQTTKYNRLYDRMTEVRDELKRRKGDQRRALLPLLKAPNIHVRLKAAITLLGIAPEQARAALMSVRDFGELPQSADAAMMLRSLDDGSYKPN